MLALTIVKLQCRVLGGEQQHANLGLTRRMPIEEAPLSEFIPVKQGTRLAVWFRMDFRIDSKVIVPVCSEDSHSSRHALVAAAVGSAIAGDSN